MGKKGKTKDAAQAGGERSAMPSGLEDLRTSLGVTSETLRRILAVSGLGGSG